MVNHGIVVAPLFFIVALLAARAGGSEDIRDMGGIAMRAPVLATIFLIVTFATLAMPGLGQLRRRVPDPARPLPDEDGRSRSSPSPACVMAAVYMLRIFIRTMHNRAGPKVDSRELRWRDALVLVPFIGVIALFALYPQIELSRARAVGHLVDQRRRRRGERAVEHPGGEPMSALHGDRGAGAHDRPAHRLRGDLAVRGAARRLGRRAARRPAALALRARAARAGADAARRSARRSA